MSGDQLDLDAPPDDPTHEEYLTWAVPHWRKRARAAEAEVQRLQATLARVDRLPHRSAWFEGANGFPAGHARDVVSYDRLRAALDSRDPR